VITLIVILSVLLGVLIWATRPEPVIASSPPADDRPPLPVPWNFQSSIWGGSDILSRESVLLLEFQCRCGSMRLCRVPVSFEKLPVALCDCGTVYTFDAHEDWLRDACQWYQKQRKRKAQLS